MKNLQFNPYQCEAGQGRPKKFKPVLTPWCWAKISPHSYPTTFAGGENPHKAKWGGAGQVRRAKIAILTHRQNNIKFHKNYQNDKWLMVN